MLDQSQSNKKEALRFKKISKFGEQVQQCMDLIKRRQTTRAIQSIKDILKQDDFLLNIFAFKGVGSIQDWIYQFPKNKFDDWFQQVSEEEVVEGNPFDLLSIAYTLQIYEGRARADVVIEQYKDLIKKMPNKYELLMGIAHIYYLNCQYRKAEQYYLLFEEKNIIQNNIVYEYLAWVYYRLGARQKSLEYVRKYSSYDDEDEESENLNIQFLNIVLNKDQKNVVRRLQKMIEDVPTYYRVYVELGRMVKEKRAKKDYFEDAEGFDNNPQIYALLAQAYIEINTKLTRELAQKAIELSGETCHYAYYVLGKMAMRQKRHDLVSKNFTLAFSLNPNNFVYLETFGKYHADINRKQQSIEYLHKCIQLNPYSDQYLFKLGCYYIDLKEYEKAEKYLTKAFEINPDSQSTLLNLGEINQIGGNFSRAIQYFGRASQITQAAIFNCHLGECYYQLNLIQNARTQGQKSISKSSQQDLEKCYELMAKIQLKDKQCFQSLKWCIQLENVRAAVEPSQIFNQLVKENGRQTIQGMIVAIINTRVDPANFPAKSLMKLCKFLKMEKEKQALQTKWEYKEEVVKEKKEELGRMSHYSFEPSSE